MNASGGYERVPSAENRYARRVRPSWQQQDASTIQEGTQDRRAARIQATQDRNWELEQRNWQRQDRTQRLRDEQAARMRNLAMSEQAQIDQARRFTSEAMAGAGTCFSRPVISWRP